VIVIAAVTAVSEVQAVAHLRAQSDLIDIATEIVNAEEIEAKALAELREALPHVTNRRT
jgi:hypothetical protein